MGIEGGVWFVKLRNALALYQNRIWSFTQQGVESYDPHTDTWRVEASPSISRKFGTAWSYLGKLYFACGRVEADWHHQVGEFSMLK